MEIRNLARPLCSDGRLSLLVPLELLFFGQRRSVMQTNLLLCSFWAMLGCSRTDTLQYKVLCIVRFG